MDFPTSNGIYMEPGGVIRTVGNPVPDDNIVMDHAFEIAELPVKILKRKTKSQDRLLRDNKLTPEEEQRRKVRRERNKVAASKCRMKRKEHVNTLRQASEELESANSQLEAEIAYLTAERDQLEMMLDAHVCNMDKAAGRGPA
ncbi:Proto-oncogene c-Fos [Stylophora pistillata]|uniref:Proto-oncogene c-Fos n=1 Tax=Stylophora pistillata TaxID=50429 RepID=A0A2B4RK92_STYPI|nr:Proto-oncogene c-Fos [Stylophora pistillata]